jgi:hypothetical protein
VSNKSGRDCIRFAAVAVSATKGVIEIKPTETSIPHSGNSQSSASISNSFASLEAQKAAEIAADLLINGIITTSDDLGKALIDWCLTRLKPEKPIYKSAPSSQPDRTKTKIDKLEKHPFPNAGAFMTKAYDDYKLTRSQVLEFPVVAKLFNEGKLSEAWEKLVDEIDKVRREAR